MSIRSIKFLNNDLPRNYKASFYEDHITRKIKEAKDGPISNIKIRKNPHYKNPLGDHISSVHFIALSDFHYYPYPDIDSAHEPTHHLVFAKVPYFLFQTIPAFLKGKRKTWYSVGKPKRNNLALECWPKAISSHLPNDLSKNLLVVNLGDYAPDAAQYVSFLRAIEKSQNVMQSISDIYRSRYNLFTNNDNINVEEFKASGNHEKDMRPWRKQDLLEPTSTFYDAVGQTFFLQEIKNGPSTSLEASPKKAILCLDTDLLDNYWLQNVKKNANPSLYKTIQEYSKIQNQLIDRAKDLEEVIVVGHVPKITKLVAKSLNAKKTTIIAGDKHYPISNTKTDPWWVKLRGKQKRLTGKVIRNRYKHMDIYQIGATSMGIGGIELLTNPTIFSVSMSTNSQTLIQPISLGKNFDKEYRLND